MTLCARVGSINPRKKSLKKKTPTNNHPEALLLEPHWLLIYRPDCRVVLTLPINQQPICRQKLRLFFFFSFSPPLDRGALSRFFPLPASPSGGKQRGQNAASNRSSVTLKKNQTPHFDLNFFSSQRFLFLIRFFFFFLIGRQRRRRTDEGIKVWNRADEK